MFESEILSDLTNAVRNDVMYWANFSFQFGDELMSAIFFFGMSNSVVNPIIYGAFSLWPFRNRNRKKGTFNNNNNNRSSFTRYSTQTYFQCLWERSAPLCMDKSFFSIYLFIHILKCYITLEQNKIDLLAMDSHHMSVNVEGQTSKTASLVQSKVSIRNHV